MVNVNQQCMWDDLSDENKKKYKKWILGFAGLSEAFAQKYDGSAMLVPILNSKFQEKAFQKAFNARCTDVGNKPYDAMVCNGQKIYLVGIKTFRYKRNRNLQKIAQFKNDYTELQKCQKNPRSLAKKVSEKRNIRLITSQSEILGPQKETAKNARKKTHDVKSVYHLLLPDVLKIGNKKVPGIHVQEVNYDTIKIDNISIIPGSANKKSIDFKDGQHNYHYTFADCQLYMDFGNISDIATWEVLYVEDVYAFFTDIQKSFTKKQVRKIEESHSWKIKIERYSGINAFFGLSPKTNDKQREKFLLELDEKKLKKNIKDNVRYYLSFPANKKVEKEAKEKLREKIFRQLKSCEKKDREFIEKNIRRPQYETYIPIPSSKSFHITFPDFFGKDLAVMKPDGKTLAKSVEERKFTVVLEPSGTEIEMIVNEDYGKAIESKGDQGLLGKWILRDIFQLTTSHVPLTQEKMESVGINGVRLYKEKGSEKIHFEFIWIDDDNLPEDYWPT